MDYFVPITILLVLTSSGYASRCTSHEQCEKVKANTYCYQRRECVDCFSCSLYNRMPGEKNCAHDRNDCGPCKPGWHAEKNIDGTLSTCIPIQNITLLTENILTSSEYPEESDTSLSSTWKYKIIPGATISLTIGLILWFIYKDRNRFCTNLTQRAIQSVDGPPPYSAKEPTAPPPDIISPGCYPAPVVTNNPQILETQQAVPCQEPDWVRNGHLSQMAMNAHNDDPETDVAGAVGTGQEDQAPLLDHSDVTQESAWTPSTSGGAQTGTVPRTSFVGALSDQTAQLSIQQPQNYRPHHPLRNEDMPTSHSLGGDQRQYNNNFNHSQHHNNNSIHLVVPVTVQNVTNFHQHPTQFHFFETQCPPSGTQSEEDIRCHRQGDELSAVVVDAPMVTDSLCRSPPPDPS